MIYFYLIFLKYALKNLTRTDSYASYLISNYYVKCFYNFYVYKSIFFKSLIIIIYTSYLE